MKRLLIFLAAIIFAIVSYGQVDLDDRSTWDYLNEDSTLCWDKHHNDSGMVYIPTAIVVNHPAHGVRTFQPKAYNVESMEVWIYDVWGNLVWYSNKVEDGIFVGEWDGKNVGTPIPTGVYLCVVEVHFKGKPNCQWCDDPKIFVQKVSVIN